jgi:hypothetical protein
MDVDLPDAARFGQFIGYCLGSRVPVYWHSAPSLGRIAEGYGVFHALLLRSDRGAQNCGKMPPRIERSFLTALFSLGRQSLVEPAGHEAGDLPHHVTVPVKAKSASLIHVG